MLWFIEEKNLVQQELQSTAAEEEKHQASVHAGGHWNGKQLHQKRTWGSGGVQAEYELVMTGWLMLSWAALQSVLPEGQRK